jgi:hypothetical protein
MNVWGWRQALVRQEHGILGLLNAPVRQLNAVLRLLNALLQPVNGILGLLHAPLRQLNAILLLLNAVWRRVNGLFWLHHAPVRQLNAVLSLLNALLQPVNGILRLLHVSQQWLDGFRSDVDGTSPRFWSMSEANSNKEEPSLPRKAGNLGRACESLIPDMGRDSIFNGIRDSGHHSTTSTDSGVTVMESVNVREIE